LRKAKISANERPETSPRRPRRERGQTPILFGRLAVHDADGLDKTGIADFDGKLEADAGDCLQSAKLLQVFERKSTVVLLPWGIHTAQGTAPGFAERANVEIQLWKRAREGVAVHAQRPGSFGLILLKVAQDRENELLLEFAECFRVRNARRACGGPTHQAGRWSDTDLSPWRVLSEFA